jgi:thioredoxin 1
MKILELTEADFDKTVLQSSVPVLVDFWSPSCMPCRALVPVLDALVTENGDDVQIVKVNAAESVGLAAKYGIDMLPTLLFFNAGKVVERMVGAQSQDKIQNSLDEID